MVLKMKNKKIIIIASALVLFPLVLFSGNRCNNIARSMTTATDGDDNVIWCDIYKSDLDLSQEWNPYITDHLPFDIHAIIIKAMNKLKRYIPKQYSLFKIQSISIDRYNQTFKWVCVIRFQNINSHKETISVVFYFTGKSAENRTNKKLNISSKFNQLKKTREFLNICSHINNVRFAYRIQNNDVFKKETWDINKITDIKFKDAIKEAQKELFSVLENFDIKLDEYWLSEIEFKKLNIENNRFFIVIRFTIKIEGSNKSRTIFSIPLYFNNVTRKYQIPAQNHTRLQRPKYGVVPYIENKLN